MRNVVPRQGTEIIQNDISEYLTISEKLRNVVPRQGTEIKFVFFNHIFLDLLRNVVPRQGTETTEEIAGCYNEN